VFVGIVEVQYAAAAAVIDLSRLLMQEVGVDGHTSVDESLVGAIKRVVVDEQGNMDGTDAAGLVVIEESHCADLHWLDMTYRLAHRQTENAAEELRRCHLISRRDDQVVDLNAHVFLRV
jgi:hypothetical protein